MGSGMQLLNLFLGVLQSALQKKNLPAEEQVKRGEETISHPVVCSNYFYTPLRAI
jgi:hypothetical protein